MVLQLIPGSYPVVNNENDENEKRYIIDADNVIVEGDSSGNHVYANIFMRGRGAIVRNIWLNSLEGEHITIVDSKINAIVLTNGKESAEPVVYNCLISHLQIYPNKNNVYIKHCSVVYHYREQHQGSWRVGGGRHTHHLLYIGALEKRGSILFDKCILYDSHYLFHPYGGTAKKLLTITFKNCIIYAGEGYINNQQGDLKDVLDKYYDIKTDGEIVTQRPIFINSFTDNLYQHPASYFELSKDSPGYSLHAGIFIGKNNNLPEPKFEEEDDKPRRR